MATHETGEYAVQDEDIVGLHTHDEHEHEHHGEDYDPYDEKYERRRDEEAAIESSGDEKSRGAREDRTPPVMSGSTTESRDEGGVRNPPFEGSDGERTAHEEDSGEGPAEAGDGDDKKKKKFELTDQTNLLPVKQVMLIFAGLNCALFCSLLDQTMYVFLMRSCATFSVRSASDNPASPPRFRHSARSSTRRPSHHGSAQRTCSPLRRCSRCTDASATFLAARAYSSAA